MKIIIAGAGDVGFHLAQLLVFENKNIVLIDTNQEVLDYAATHLDVLTLKGDSSSIEVLKQAEVGRAQLLLAVTTSEKTNLITCILAKKLGATTTIARVNTQDYLEENQRAIFEELGVDVLISPRKLAAQEIHRLVKQCSFTDHFEFEDGKMSLVGITLDSLSQFANKTIGSIDPVQSVPLTQPIAILRGHKTIIPRSDTILRPNDHIYFITHKQYIEQLVAAIGKKPIKVKRIMILGGSNLSYVTAKKLEADYNVTLVEKEKTTCKKLSEYLNNTLIINGDCSDIELLEEEGLSQMDAFIALTENSETNIITSLTAKNHGVYKTIAQVENKDYIHLSQNIGVDTLINKKLIAANNIFRFVRKGKVEALASLHGVDAEVIEYEIHKNNQLTRKPLKALHFPKTALIGGVIRGDESLIPDGNFQLKVGDKVIIFALPEAINKVEKLFR